MKAYLTVEDNMELKSIKCIF